MPISKQERFSERKHHSIDQDIPHPFGLGSENIRLNSEAMDIVREHMGLKEREPIVDWNKVPSHIKNKLNQYRDQSQGFLSLEKLIGQYFNQESTQLRDLVICEENLKDAEDFVKQFLTGDRQKGDKAAVEIYNIVNYILPHIAISYQKLHAESK